jgi:hypothetical protein
MNQITYILYILISSLLVIYVGNFCYKNGQVYILNYFPNDTNLGNSINKLLRIAYYLLNIGLAIWTLHSIKNIKNTAAAILEITQRLSFILLVIAALHFINIYTVYLIHKHFKHQ